MLAIVDRFATTFGVMRLRRRAGRDRTPRSSIELCRVLERLARGPEIIGAARRGLDRFPNSAELQDILKTSWQRHGRQELELLEFKTERRPTSESFASLIDAYIAFERLADARRAAEDMARRYPDRAAASLQLGRVLLLAFERDHLAKDGEKALAAYRRATELDPALAAARRGLAEAYAAIGATSQAIFHLLIALDLAPDDPESNRLYQELRHLPFQRRQVSELLWEAEVQDESSVHRRALPRDRALLDQMVAGLCQLSELPGVRRVALNHHGVEIVAKDGHCLALPKGERDPFLALAIGFRAAASTLTKRLGMGGFQQADLRLGRGRVIAVAAGATVVMLAVAGNTVEDSLVREVRNHLACWTAADHRALEWVR